MKRISILLVLTFAIYVTSFSQTCLPDGIVFYTQEQIDNFQSNYPDCDEIEGDVRIGMGYPTDITNLAGLAVIKSIGGNLDINSHTLLESLSGLDALETIGGDLILEENESLTSITGLSALTSIGGRLFVVENNALAGLDNINELVEVGGLFTIGHNAIIESVSMDKLVSVGGIDFSYVFNLQSLEGLSSLETVGGDFIIRDCNSLPDLDGLNSLTHISGGFGLWDNNNLDNLDGLQNLETIGGFFSMGVADGYAISSIEGLASLTSIGGELQISKTNLETLAGLESLTSINGDLNIINNPNLNSIEGIRNIDSQGILNLGIRINPELSECAVESICDYLGVSARYIQIHDNAEGCNSEQEVVDDCTSGVNDENDSEFAIVPNPACDRVLISGPEGVKFENIEFYNNLGQKKNVKSDENGNYDVTDLRSGIYVVVFEYKGRLISRRLVIK